MTLKEQIEQDCKAALKERKEKEVSTLRMLLAAVKNAEIDFRGKGKEMTASDIEEIVFKEAKKHKDSIDAFQKGGRQDLVLKENEELKIVEKYLPQQLSEEEIKELVKKAVVASGAVGPKDMGKVMGLVMKEAKGRTDGAMVGKIVKEILGA